MCRQRAGCNDGTLTARKGQAATLEAWWKLPRRVLGVLGVWRLANGRLECRNKRGLCAGKGMLERWRPGPWWKLPRRVLGVLGVWRLANGRLECRNKRGLCAGKGQAAMMERWLANGRLECRNKRGLCAGKGQAAMLEHWRPGKGRLQPWRLGGSCHGGF